MTALSLDTLISIKRSDTFADHLRLNTGIMRQRAFSTSITHNGNGELAILISWKAYSSADRPAEPAQMVKEQEAAWLDRPLPELPSTLELIWEGNMVTVPLVHIKVGPIKTR